MLLKFSTSSDDHERFGASVTRDPGPFTSGKGGDVLPSRWLNRDRKTGEDLHV